MTRIIAGLVVGLVILMATAWPQEPGPDQDDLDPAKINWLKRPTGEDFSRHYPRKAFDKGVSGAAALCCVPREDGSVACKSIVDVPAGFGFGDAAVRISHVFRMSASDAQTWRERGELLRLGINFRIDGDGPRVAEALALFSERTQGICKTSEAAALFTPAPGAATTQDTKP